MLEPVPQDDAERPYHLADGVILSIGPLESCIVDIERDLEVRVDYRYIDALEQLALGGQPEGYESFIPWLTEQKVIAAGPAVPDPIILQRLRRIDALYLGSYENILTPRARAAYEAVLLAHARRKRFFERVGQCPVLPETALRRALLVGDAQEVGAKDVLCLGDDDLVSIALALLGHRVTVYDIDDFLLTFLRRSADALHLPMRIVERDLRDPLKPDECGQFDVFLTDPMSNRDCFEIFLSRAFSLLRPAGVGFTAVYPPVSQVFREVADAMRFEICHWYRSHNRYYARHFKLNAYESDWVEVRKTAATVAKHAPEAFSVPLNLYREDYHQRPRSSATFIDRIEDERLATPMYLDVLFDILERVTQRKPLDRVLHMAQDWTLIHCPFPQGFLTLHVDRARHQIAYCLQPAAPDLEKELRNLLLAAYKSQAGQATVSVGRAAWDVRVL